MVKISFLADGAFDSVFSIPVLWRCDSDEDSVAAPGAPTACEGGPTQARAAGSEVGNATECSWVLALLPTLLALILECCPRTETSGRRRLIC